MTAHFHVFCLENKTLDPILVSTPHLMSLLHVIVRLLVVSAHAISTSCLLYSPSSPIWLPPPPLTETPSIEICSDHRVVRSRELHSHTTTLEPLKESPGPFSGTRYLPLASVRCEASERLSTSVLLL